MKKVSLRILAVVFVLLMGLSLVSCKSGGSTGSTTTTAPTAESTTAEATADENGLVNGKFPTVEAFVKSDIMQETMKGLKESLEDEDMAIDLKADGNKLVYVFTIKNVEEDQREAVKSGLESAMESQAETYENIAGSMKDAVDVENPVVVVLYQDGEGNEIYSREFTK